MATPLNFITLLKTIMNLDRNIINIIENEGIQLRRSGRVYKARCPFHEDRTPSFCVYPESNRFICFGCSQKGDAIDFVRQLKDLTFKEAITYLGINGDAKIFQKNTARQNQKRALIQSFRKWCNQYYDELSADYRTINKVMGTFKTIEEAENSAALYHRLPELEHQMDIVAFGDDQEKFELYHEVRNGL